MDKVKTIMLKEWAEVFKNRLVLFSVVFLPLIFIALPVITIVAVPTGEEQVEIPNIEEETEIFPGMEAYCADLSGSECVVVYTLNLYTFMFMILPVAIPVTIAAYSIVGEKTSRSLEPLLATPITTVELLAGKALSAIVPAVGATWISYLIYVVLVGVISGSQFLPFVLEPWWLLAIFVVGPLLTFLAVCVSIMVSSRVTDPRVAEQLSMVVILPIILIIIGQSIGLVLIDQQLVLFLGLLALVLDIVLGYISIQIFQRERILTQWK
jgi:ABC-2 type transport system permease protein